MNNSEVKVSNLKDKLHVSLNGNTLIRGKSKKLVIIHDGIHRFNPVSIQISIKDNPLGVSVSFLREISEFAREESINPLTSLDVHNTIELIGVNDLRVNLIDLNKVKKIFIKEKPDFVFHLAAKPLVKESYVDPVETWQTNMIGTINVLESLRCLV